MDEYYTEKNRKDGRQAWCKSCHRSRRNELYQENKVKEYEQIKKYRKNPMVKLKIQGRAHNISEIQLVERLAHQNWRCITCNFNLESGFQIDHDHLCCPPGKFSKGSGKKSCGSCIRGLLCRRCNLALGVANDDQDRLIALYDYLVNWKLGQQGRVSHSPVVH